MSNYSNGFTQVLNVGKYSLCVKVVTLIALFSGDYVWGKLFKIDWKLSSLILAGTEICGGTAITSIVSRTSAKLKI